MNNLKGIFFKSFVYLCDDLSSTKLDKMLTKNLDIFHILLSAVSEGVIIVDEHQKIVEANESVERIFGYERKELLKKPLNILIPPKYHAGHGAHFKSFINQNEKSQMGQGRDFFGIRKDGQIFPVEIGLNNFNIYDNNFVMALISDISIRKQRELEKQKSNERLEREVERRTSELKKAIVNQKRLIKKLDNENIKRKKAEAETKIALDKEKELNELKTKFLSLVSHEFKTPLSGILTSALLLRKYKTTEQQEKRDKHIQTITDEVHYLDTILNDFLSLDKLDKGKANYNYDAFKISKVVNEVVYNANILLKDGQKINYPENIDDISLYQDEKIVELALSNLVNNAIKYSFENTRIDLDVVQNEVMTIFKVKDNGIGIPLKDQKNIFNRYFRAENVLLTQGTGIGLNIVKDHLNNLNGKIYFESKENEGSIFTIELPNNAKQ